MKSLVLGIGLAVTLAAVPPSMANSLLRDIWALVVQSPAPGNLAEMETLAGRTQALYLANGLPAAGELDTFGVAGARIQVWTSFFMGPTVLDISDLQLFRLLRLAQDPANNTMAYLRGAFGTVLVSNYVAALSASDLMAVQLLEITDVTYAPSGPGCIDADDFEQALRAEFERRRDIFETSIVLTGRDASAWLAASFKSLKANPALALDELRLEELRVDDESLSLFLDSSCGVVVLKIALAAVPPTPVVQIGTGPLSDTMLELNRYILAETNVR